MVIKSKDKTRARQRKGALSNWKVKEGIDEIELYCTVPYCIVLYYTVLYCTILYYAVLYCTVLY